MALLYQFAGSHFCEKARWALDHKGLTYESVNLVPGPHLKTARRLAPQTSLPILVDDEHVVQGSAEIIDYLDKKIPQFALTPLHSTDASMARELERYLDRNIGINIRLLFYYHAFKDRAFVSNFLLRDGPWWGRPFFFVAYPAIKRKMVKAMQIDATHAQAARNALLQAFDQLDERVAGRKYLAGPHFSRADLTAAALLFHRWDDSWSGPAALDEFFRDVRHRPFYEWAGKIYTAHRHARVAGNSK